MKTVKDLKEEINKLDEDLIVLIGNDFISSEDEVKMFGSIGQAGSYFVDDEGYINKFRDLTNEERETSKKAIVLWT